MARSTSYSFAGIGGHIAGLFAVDPKQAPLDPRRAMLYFDLVLEDYNVEEDARSGNRLAKKMMRDDGLTASKMEMKAVEYLSKLFGVRISNEGHGPYGSVLICKFSVNSVADVRRAYDVLARHHTGGDDEIGTDQPYFSARAFRVYPQGVNGPSFGVGNNVDGTMEEWLEAHNG